MQVTKENETFAALSAEFAIRFVEFMARTLHRNVASDFDLGHLTQEAEALLYDICFFGIAQIEERSGMVHEEVQYAPLASFETIGQRPYKIVVGDAVIHGLLEDDVMAEGISRARAHMLGAENAMSALDVAVMEPMPV